MKKHWLFTTILAIALCVICFTLFPTEAKAASARDLTFTLNSDGQSYAVTDCSESASGALTIPSTYNGKPVTTIGSRAFWDCSSLTSVTIPESVITIGNSAFYGCFSLTKVTIGDGVTSIGGSAFQDCDSLKTINLPDCLTSIGHSAFAYCYSLNSVTIGDSITNIGINAFYDCDNLTKVYISNPSAWCTLSFENYASNPMYYADELHVLDNDGNEASSITLDATVTEIPSKAFLRCTGLTSVTIPGSVTSIGDSAFYGCTGLTSVTIPGSVTSIGGSAFSNCDSLTTVTIGNGVTSIDGFAFSNCDSLTSVTIGNGVTSIGDCAFEYCASLTSVTIPDSVTSIGAYAFYDCNSLASVTIPDSVTSIGWYAFISCERFSNIYYTGTKTQWEQIASSGLHYRLNGGMVHYDWNCDNGHHWNFGTVTKEATCKSTGVKTYTCEVCGKTKTKTIAKESHSYNAATCTKPKTCKVCGATNGKKLGHSYTNACDKTCNRCSAKRTIKHTYTNACDKSCNVCKATRTIKHTYKTTTTKATFSKNGSVVKKCTACGREASKTTIRYVKSIKLSATSYVYNGKVKTPTVTVKDSAGKTLKKDTDYTVTYASGRKNAGTYKVTIKLKGNYSGTKTLTFKILPAAKVTTQPKTQKVEGGEKIKFTVKATGTGLKYQWQSSSNGKTWKNCSSSSAKKATFTFTSKTSHDGNYYRCKVTDSAGNVVYTSKVRAYVLGIKDQPDSKTVTKGKTAKFTVEATGASKTYQWQYSTNGGKTWKNITSTASAKKATLSFTTKTSHNGNYYRCRIKDSGGNTIYTNKVKLTVKK